MKVVNVAWIISSTLIACMLFTPVAANEIQEELKAIDQKITKEEKKIKEQQVKQKKAKRALSKTKKEINQMANNSRIPPM